MIERTLFQPDHQAFADSFRRFIEKEVTPHHAEWEDQGYVAREVWSQAGANGFLCMSLPEEYGGAGADKLYSVAQMEELARAGTTGIGFGLHSEIVAPYILQNTINYCLSVFATILMNHIHDAFFAILLFRLVHRLREAVGKQEEKIIRFQLHGCGFIL